MIVYLTRFRINTARRGARKLLSSPQAMHAAVLASFADPITDGGGPRTLWRVDGSGHDQVLYLVSPTEPDLTHLVEQAGWPTTEAWQTRRYADFLASLRAGHVWAFRLTANPVRNGRLPHRSDTQRIGHVTVEQQRHWLMTRAARAGFRIPTVAETGEPDVTVHRRHTYTFNRDGRRVTLRVATYDGRLEVTDPDALRTVLTIGLGHAKSYGCGLLTLARPS
jgi:CRISPR system Cascade subunit CasE